MYQCTPSSTQIRGLNFNIDPQGFFLGGRKLGIAATRATQKPFFALLKTFKYTEVIANHYNYRGAVDEHNAYRHDCGTKHGLSLEETGKTTRWANRVFAFILAVSEVNAYLAMRYFGELKMTQLEFRKKLAFKLIHNTLESGTEEERPERRRNTRQNTLHNIITAPPHSGFEGGKWVKKYKQKY